LHIKKYHKNNISKNTQSIQKNSIQTSENFQCVYCDKILSRSDNLKRHEKTCKKKDEDDIFKDEKIKEAYHKEIEQFKADFFKAMKVHPKTADKINNQISSNNTNSNKTNKGTIINNNINLIIPLGKENFNEVLSDAQKVSIVKANEKAIYKFTEIIYTDPALEKYRNVSITNINGDHANTYDEKFAKYVLNKKLEIINKYGWNRLCDIEEFIADLENKNIDVGNIDKLTVLIDRYAKDEEFKKIFNNELVILLYNYNRYVKRNLKKINKEILLRIK
jgi:hypothetical protein